MKFVIKPANQYPLTESVINDYGCYRISRYIEIHTNGDITICCETWLPKFFGNILTNTNNEILENLGRLSLINDMDNGKFTECNDHCPFLSSIISNNYIPGYIVPLNKLQEEKKNQPILINFSYDQSCNLQCASCRNDLILYSLAENSKVNEIHDRVKDFVDYLLIKGERVLLNITGSGDAFAGPTYWNYIKNLIPNDNLLLRLSTNGISMTESRWLEMKHMWNSVYKINISIDAYSSETYSIVRKNGSLEKVKKNLENLNDLISKKSFKQLKEFITVFTVQRANYREILDFVKWQLEYDQLTAIYFNLVVKWGHISESRFVDEFELSKTEKKELSKILKDDIFNNPKIILGNLNSIKNYESN